MGIYASPYNAFPLPSMGGSKCLQLPLLPFEHSLRRTGNDFRWVTPTPRAQDQISNVVEAQGRNAGLTAKRTASGDTHVPGDCLMWGGGCELSRLEVAPSDFWPPMQTSAAPELVLQSDHLDVRSVCSSLMSASGRDICADGMRLMSICICRLILFALQREAVQLLQPAL